MGLENSFLNMRVEGMSRHAKVTSGGVSRSICARCTCVRSFHIDRFNNTEFELWIYEDTSNEPREKFGTVRRGGVEAKVYVPPTVFAQAWDGALSPDTTETHQINVQVLVVDDGDYPVISYSMDELSKVKESQPPKSSWVGRYTSVVLWSAAALYIAYAVAKYLRS
jgi:hypothetical protein